MVLSENSPEVLNLCEKYRTIEMGNEAVDSVKSDCFNTLRDMFVTDGYAFLDTFEAAYKKTVAPSLPGAYRSAKSVLIKALRTWQNDTQCNVPFETFIKDSDGNYLGKTALSKLTSKPKLLTAFQVASKLVLDLPTATDLTDEERRMINHALYAKGYNTSYVP